MYSIQEEKLIKKLHTLKRCPLCGKAREDGGHVKGCELTPYMAFLPKDLKIGDKVGIPDDWGTGYYPCIVTKIVDDFTCLIYEESINKTHTQTSPIMIVDDDGNTHCEGDRSF